MDGAVVQLWAPSYVCEQSIGFLVGLTYNAVAK